MARSPSTYTPKKAGEEIGASADTIRRYCQLYRRHLSEGATPTAGKSRVLTAVDVHLLKLAKQSTEAGSTVEEVDAMLDSVAIPEDLVADDVGVETLPTVIPAEAPEAVYLLRQMASTLDRLASQGDRLASLEGEVAGLRRLVEKQAAVETPPKRSSAWSAYAPFLIGLGIVALFLLVVAVVVALLK